MTRTNEYTNIEEVPQEVLLKRLRRLEGQIRGIQKMIEDNRDCVDIVTQLAAVRSGIEGIGALVLNKCMQISFNKRSDVPDNLTSLSRAVEIWGRVRVAILNKPDLDNIFIILFSSRFETKVLLPAKYESVSTYH